MGAGAGLGGFFVPVVTFLVDKYDWRTALFIVSLGFVAIGLPLSLLLRHKPEPYGYLPDGASEIQLAVKKNRNEKDNVPGITAKQALKTRIFWQLALAASLISIVSASVTAHVMPYLSSVGINRIYSSTIVLFVSLVSVLGRISSGWLGDRFNTKLVYIFFLALMVIGTVCFAFIVQTSPWAIILFVIFYGLGWAGSVSLRPVLLRKYFQHGKFGTILGIADGMMMLGQIGIPLAGWVYDTWSSYQGLWLIYAALIIIGMVLLWITPKSLVIQPAEATP